MKTIYSITATVLFALTFVASAWGAATVTIVELGLAAQTDADTGGRGRQCACAAEQDCPD